MGWATYYQHTSTKSTIQNDRGSGYTCYIYVPVAYDVVSYDTQCHKKALVLYRIPHRRKRGGKLNDSDKTINACKK
jgi:hypothetical protein